MTLRDRIEAETEPDEEDAYLYPTGPLGAQTGVSYAGKFLGTFTEEDDAREALQAEMDAQKFWPNVWYQDDHGGLTLTDTLTSR